MCGIVAVQSRSSQRPGPTVAEVVDPVEAALAVLESAQPLADLSRLDRAASDLETVSKRLAGPSGAAVLIAEVAARNTLAACTRRIRDVIAELDRRLDAGAESSAAQHDLEEVNRLLIRIKDAAWSIGSDRLRAATEIIELSGHAPSSAAIRAYWAIQQALSALDRLEVRGRDSAGIQVAVTGHGLDLTSPTVAELLDRRAGDPLFTSGAVRASDGSLSFVYKAAAEIGELGDNTRALRAEVTADDLLRMAVEADTAQAVVLGHTRWASVGIISQPNAHPLDSLEMSEGAGPLDSAAPIVTAVLNGDVDNFADIKAADGLRIAPEITTDAKVIPTLVARHLDSGVDMDDAFRTTVAALDGSVAIGSLSSDEPDQMCFALRGSGQALYVGLSDEAYIVASEPYGVIESSDRYLRLDGETPADPDNPVASRGQIVVLDRNHAGSIEGIRRLAYDGTALPVDADELALPAITTRDIDRGEHPHFLLKEISEAPNSFRTTLRGKLVAGNDGNLQVTLSDSTLPAAVRADLESGAITRILAIGQGTAAVAGQSLVAALKSIGGEQRWNLEATLATELSGFHLRPDMSDTLVVAISQSGTTTDTNRTVDLVRSRGGQVIAIVNRRGSDLTDKADGVLYTSDGRDIEMSVASTKAFYSQLAAGFVLAVALADAAGLGDPLDRDRQALLAGLREIPEAMETTLALRPQIGRAAQRFAPSRRSWAMVGNGQNLIAARELRIKLSELCYKSIACDSTEDKKHIDLSSEPMILVCAAGLSGSTADDVAKEVAIYRAHKAAPIVIASEGETRYQAALDVISVPAVHPQLGFVLATMVGHLFGYEAALAIDAQALPLRQIRSSIEELASAGLDAHEALARLTELAELPARRYLEGLRAGEYDGHLEAATAVRLTGLLRFALGMVPLDLFEVEFGKVGTPGVVIEDLTDAVTRAIEELTRPIDAIKHQAKTVTVGISRSDESLLDVRLVASVLDAGAGRDRLSYRTLRTLADLDAAVAEVTGFTRYAIEGRVDDESLARATVVDKGGIAVDIPSRIEREPELRGTKHQVAREREVFVNVGRSDGRITVLVPEVKGNVATGITLLHVRLADSLGAGQARSVLQGYRGRYAALRNAVMETEPVFRDDVLAELPVVDLLTAPIQTLADHWRSET